MFEDDDDDVDFNMDLSLSDPSIYDGQEDSPSPAVKAPVRAGEVSTGRKFHFSISALTDPEPGEDSEPGPAMRQQLRHPGPALPQARRDRDQAEPQANSAVQTFKMPARPKENQNGSRLSGGGGPSGPPGPTPPQPAENLVRKFPGPAGLILPERPCRPGDKRRVPLEPSELLKKKKKKPEKVREPEEFKQEKNLAECFTWRKALEELRALGQDSEVLHFNTDWIRRQTAAGAAVGFKIPFFLGKIVKMDTEHRDPRVVLLDDQGKIDGSLHRDILETYSLDIRPGTVLLVMKAAVLSTGRKTSINVTLNNLVAIYSHHHQVRSHQNVSVDQMRATAVEVERERVEEEKEEEKEEERVVQQSGLTPVMPSPCVGRTPQPSQAFTPMMRTASREGQSGGAFSPVFSTVGSPFSPVHEEPQPGQRSPLVPSLAGNIQFNSSVRPPSAFPGVSLESPVRPRPSLTPGLPSLHLSTTSPTSPSQASPSPPVVEGRPKFVFKPRPVSTTSMASQASSLPSQPASQQLVASLMSDLDTSDIWADF